MSDRPEPFTAEELRHIREYLEYQQTPITLRDINDKLDALMAEEQDKRDKVDQRVEVMWKHMFPNDPGNRSRSEHLEIRVRSGVRALLEDLRSDQWIDKDTFDQLILEGNTRVGGTNYLRLAPGTRMPLKEDLDLLHRVLFAQYQLKDIIPVLGNEAYDKDGKLWRRCPESGEANRIWTHEGSTSRYVAGAARSTLTAAPFFLTLEAFQAWDKNIRPTLWTNPTSPPVQIKGSSLNGIEG